MQLITFQRRLGGDSLAQRTNYYHHREKDEEVGLVLPCGRILPLALLNPEIHSMNDVIDMWEEQAGEELRTVVDSLRRDQVEEAFGLSLLLPEAVRILSPIPHPRQDVLCLGLNYHAHNEEAAAFLETKKEAPPKPIYFAKRAEVIYGPEDEIPAHEHLTSTVDYEVELAVIIGKDAYDVLESEALDYVFGYSVFNDVSARDLQKERGQWYLGKSLRGHSVMGPKIVTADEWTQNQPITCHVNGEERQASVTGNMIVSVEQAIAELSRTMGLKKGSIIAMGTPAGVAMGMENPTYLKEGDVVRCEIGGIGVLENRVGK